MEPNEVAFLLRAKRQLRLRRFSTIACCIISALLFLASFVLPPFYQGLVLRGSYTALLAALLASSDFSLSATVVSRRELIDVLEAHLNRDALALTRRGSLGSGGAA